jgi:hypothetical protein
MMRNGQNKRMRGRNRNNNNHGHNQNRGHHHHNPLTRVYESNGPDVKIRGTAHHIAEKYLQLARDATSVGDHVTAEAHHQHAEHYFRLIAAAQEQFRQQNPHYQPQPAQAEDNREGGSDGAGGEISQQPAQIPQNFASQQNFQPQQQQPYGGQQPQPYGGPQPHFGRPQQQQQQQHQPQHQPQPPQHQQQQHAQPHFGGDVGGLPSFITGGQPQPPQQQFGSNGHDGQGDRFHRRRRRHRGPHNPQQQDTRGGDAPDDSRPGND